MCKTCTTFSARPSLQNDMDGGVAAALIEKEADDDLLTIARAQRDEARRERDVLRRERDEARRHECSDLDAHWRLDEALASLREANATVASLRTAQPSPFTADDITDEMVERARNAPSFDGRLSPTPRLVREMLTAALTEPPARPEGAEEIEAWRKQYEYDTDRLWGELNAADARIRDLAQGVLDERGAALDALEQIKVRDARVAVERRLRMKAAAAAAKAEARIKAVQDVLDRHAHYGLVEVDDIRRALDGAT